MRGKWVVVLFVFAGLAAAQGTLSYEQLTGILKSSVEQELRDKEIANYLKHQKLNFALTDALIEEFQGWGVGPRTLKVLHQLKASAAHLEPPKTQQAEPEDTGPPPPSEEEQRRIIAEARRNALNYTDGLPDYLCLQVTRRYVDPSGLEVQWLKHDEVKTRVTYLDDRENYEVISVNNRVTNKPLEELGGAISTGEFGSMLAAVFDPSTRTEFSWARHSKLRGRGVYVFEIYVPRERSDWRLSVENEQDIVTGYRGLVYIDKETERVLRIYMRAENIPPDFPMQEAQTRLDYDFIEISGRDFLLPLKARVRMRTGRMLSRNEVEFRLYRKFSADSVISFEEAEGLAPLPEEDSESGPPTTHP